MARYSAEIVFKDGTRRMFTTRFGAPAADGTPGNWFVLTTDRDNVTYINGDQVLTIEVSPLAGDGT